jgi:hypothetical protein
VDPAQAGFVEGYFELLQKSLNPILQRFFGCGAQ